jgi:hypothetical protein
MSSKRLFGERFYGRQKKIKKSVNFSRKGIFIQENHRFSQKTPHFFKYISPLK